MDATRWTETRHTQEPPWRERARKAAHAALAFVLGRLHGPRTKPPPVARTEPPLDALNAAFHEVYDAARESAHREGPVFVVLADELVVFRDGVRTAYSFSPQAFHVIKAATHAPVALFTWLHDRTPPEPAALAAFRARLCDSAARVSSTDLGLTAQARGDLQVVLAACLALVERGPERATTLEGFARQLGPVLLRLSHEATRIQLAQLHAHTQQALSPLTPSERRALQVVVAGNHQARARSLAMQYFEKRFDEPPGVERRITYAEGVCDEQAALLLVGTRRIDRVLARAFFGDERRLQRDILGDAARDQLSNAVYPPVFEDGLNERSSG